MADTQDPLTTVTARLRRPLLLTWAGLIAERLVRALWPVWSLLALAAALLMLGVQDVLGIETVWTLGALMGIATLGLLVRGLGRLRLPHRADALARLDDTLPGRPFAALADHQAVGAGDAGSQALWRVHQQRMAARAAGAQAVEPDLRLSRHDPFGLRYVALLTLVMALLFGSIWRAGSVTDMMPGGGGGAALAQGPTWEGWVEPPRYTGRPSLYLADQTGTLRAPEGSEVTLRFYGAADAYALRETVSGTAPATPEPDTEIDPDRAPEQSFEIARDGELRVDGPGGRIWEVEAIADVAPEVTLMEDEVKTAFDGQTSLPFAAEDDYGVVAGTARITLDLDAVDRRHGLATDPEPRDPLTLDLPMPLSGDRADFTETLIENLSQHPWAHLPVTVKLQVEDAIGQTGQSDPVTMDLPARRFFNPMAAAVIEQRRDLLWSRDNGRRVAQVLRAVSYKPREGLFRSEAAYLRLRVIIRRLESGLEGGLDNDRRDEIAQALWDLGLLLEDGNLDDALERMRDAQERLSEAMRNGASEEEIARLMQDLRAATEDYLRQKMQQAQREDPEGGDDQRSAENMMQMNQQDLQDMMDRIQELMNEGRFAEAQQALEEFQRMMENMQVTQGQGGQGQSPGQEAMEGLAETLRDQQGLSDQAFRDLQDQFNPGGQPGQPQGNQGQRGQGQGGQPGQPGQGGTQPGEGQRGQGQNGQGQNGQGQAEGDLADRQEALRRELERQRQGLPGLGGEAGDAARGALEDAERSMERAEEALRGDDLAGAIDNQADAMESLREGMRNMGEALAEQQQNPGGQGEGEGAPGQAQADPLGRESGQGGRLGTQSELLQGEDVYRRARDLLDEIRRRSGEGDRPELELDYLERLLERF
ncbi:TIGR02302 family protein [Roseovarius sp. D22-M7]|uniref:TIGR02302 family protein n=1 Tax=Roseovarius sp. D22-M7 TaxID=3127116 RepID=UPI00300FD587